MSLQEQEGVAARPAGLPKGAQPLWTPALAGRQGSREKAPCSPAVRVITSISVKGSLRRYPRPVPGLRSGLRPPIPPLTPITAREC